MRIRSFFVVLSVFFAVDALSPQAIHAQVQSGPSFIGYIETSLVGVWDVRVPGEVHYRIGD